jgi:hypothetical protein
MADVKVTREHRVAAAQLTVKHSVPKHLVEEWKGRDAPLPQHIVDIGYFAPLLATAQALAEAEARGAARERERCVGIASREAGCREPGETQDALFGLVAMLHSEATDAIMAKCRAVATTKPESDEP